jgi:DNA-binding response OmpR family regulator
VVVVEDSPDLRLAVRMTLGLAGWTVIEAATGAAGLEAAAAGDVDAVLVDLGLPDMDGREVVRRLKAAPVTAAIPVVVLSGTASAVTVQEALDAGAVGFVPKPFSHADLEAALLAGRRAAEGLRCGGGAAVGWS